jgi:enoyl-CoA hydratase/carnithine racemase
MDLASYVTFKFERRGRLLIAKFNNPETLNAIDHEAHAEIARFFTEVAKDAESDVIVLSGEGRAFSAGGNLHHMQRMIDQPAIFVEEMADAKRIIAALLDVPKPVIAKVNGHAIGLGATIALFCDVVFAALDAKIADPHVRVGLVAGDGGAVIWPHLIGHALAKEYLLTGKPILAQDAERIGLINHAVPATELDRAVDAFVDELLATPARAMRWTKLSINAGLKQSALALLDASLALEALSNLTQDHREAIAALREKREPEFTGK